MLGAEDIPDDASHYSDEEGDTVAFDGPGGVPRPGSAAASAAVVAKPSSLMMSGASDATKALREELDDSIRDIFLDLSKDLNKMETRIKAGMVSSLEKEEMTFFAGQAEKEMARLRTRQDQEKEREQKAFATLVASREARQRGKNLQNTMNFTAKNRDMIIQSQDKAQHIEGEAKQLLDDLRHSFEDHLAHVEARHTKKRKKLTQAFDRKMADRRVLFNLETAHLSPEMRATRTKDFQFKMNHQKAADKKVAEHRRETQALEIRQMREMFDFEIKALEEIQTVKAGHARDLMDLAESHRRAVFTFKDRIRNTEYSAKSLGLQLAHSRSMGALLAQHRDEYESALKKQQSMRWARVSRWKVVLKRETGLDSTFSHDADAGISLTTLFMDPQTTITRYEGVASHPAIETNPDVAPIPLVPSILGNDAVAAVQPPPEMLGDGIGLSSMSTSSSPTREQLSDAAATAAAAANGAPAPISTATSGTAASDASTTATTTSASPTSPKLDQVRDEQIKAEELQRLTAKLAVMRQDLAELKVAQRTAMADLARSQEADLARLQDSVRARSAALRVEQQQKAASVKQGQEEELASLEATQAKEAAMDESIRAADHAMLMERKTLNSVLETVGDGIINLTPKGIVNRFNARAESIFGYSSGDVIGRHVGMLQPLGLPESEMLETYLTSETYVYSVGKSVRARRADGTVFPLHLSISEVKDNDLHLFTAIVRDLTDEEAAKAAAALETEQKRNTMASLIQQLARERSRSADLIHAMLPAAIAPRLLKGEVVPPEQFEEVTIMFTEIEGFSELANTVSGLDMVDLLDTLYCVFDEIILGYNVYKVETVNDSYVCVSGVPEPMAGGGPAHAAEMAKLALHFTRAISRIRIRSRPDLELQLKVGMHSGPCVAGVVGKKCGRYCLFGDTMNTASRMKSTGEAHRIHVSTETHARLVASNQPFAIESRGEIPVKGKGNMHTYWINSLDGFQPDIKIVDNMLESMRSLASQVTVDHHGDVFHNGPGTSVNANVAVAAPASLFVSTGNKIGVNVQHFGSSETVTKPAAPASPSRRGELRGI
ncbi:adenylate and guanylate cyclase catalytic domain-containing protein [Blastocladiella britannica]|nr:adenylate and guanylate cyclase catalytic domain-containing protein [Blastocladiella britannica]